MKAALASVLADFQLNGELTHWEPTGNGHINDSYAVRLGDGPRYVVQRINHHVFPDPAALMENITRVTAFLREQLVAEGAELARKVLTLVTTRDGGSFTRDEAGNYWRVYEMIEDAVTYDSFQNEHQAFRVAEAFGDFQRRLARMTGPPLHEVIPNFHNGLQRLARFREVLAADVHGRAAGAREEIEFLEAKASIFEVVPRLFAEGRLPMRVTHNDTKVNNVLLDRHSGEVLCVIDLDTVMPGSALFDFGDMIRTGGNLAAEDEPDLSRVDLDVPMVTAMTRGYLSGASAMLTEVEREHLFFSAQLISLMIGTRFLTDYLDGDLYFKIHRPQHNLERSRAQFQLLRCMQRRQDEMEKMIRDLWDELHKR